MTERAVDLWLDRAMGPIFVAALAFMVLGLLRQALLLLGGLRRERARAGDPHLDASRIARRTLRWLLPARALARRTFQGLATTLLHAGLLVVPLFVAGHAALLSGVLGVAWPALPPVFAEGLALAALAAALGMVAFRLRAPDARALSRPGDQVLLLLVALPFATGLLAAHPRLNPFDARATLLVHVLAADLLLFLVPVTRIAHCALLPFTQLASQVAWRFVPGAGARVARDLGKEPEAV